MTGASTHRVFLDANVLFSAAYRPDAGLLKLWELDAVELVTSTYTVEEARRNHSTSAQRRALGELIARVEVVAQPRLGPALQDSGLPEKDLPVLAAALSARATHLLTGDRRHFGRFFGKQIEGIRVMLPGAYLRRDR